MKMGGVPTSYCLYQLITLPMHKAPPTTLRTVLIGPHAVGKSALVARAARQVHDSEYRMTLKPYSQLRTVQVGQNEWARLEMTDTVGSGVQNASLGSLIADRDSVLLVYDITNEESLTKLEQWLGHLRSMLPKEVLLGLVGTHLDEPYKRQVSYQDALRFKKRNSLNLLFEISSRSGQGVSEMLEEVVKQILMKQLFNRSSEPSHDDSTLCSGYVDVTGAMGMTGGMTMGKLWSRVGVLEKKLKLREKECETAWNEYQELLEQTYNGGAGTVRADWGQVSSRSQKWQEKINELNAANRQAHHQAEEYYRSMVSLQGQKRQLMSQITKLQGSLVEIEQAVAKREEETRGVLKQKEEYINELTSKIDADSAYFASKYQEHMQNQKELNKKIQQLEEELEEVQDLNQEHLDIIEEMQQKMCVLRQQTVEKHYLRQQLQLQQEKCIRLELTYQETISLLSNQYSSLLHQTQQQQQQLAQNKKVIVQRSIQDKINEINQIKGYLSQMATEPPLNTVHQQSQQQEDDIRGQVMDRILQGMGQVSSQILDQLNRTLKGLQILKKGCLGLLDSVQGVDLMAMYQQSRHSRRSGSVFLNPEQSRASQHKDDEIKVVQSLEEKMSQQVATQMTIISDIIAQFDNQIETFRGSLGEIDESVERITGMAEIGIDEYIAQNYS